MPVGIGADAGRQFLEEPSILVDDPSIHGWLILCPLLDSI